MHSESVDLPALNLLSADHEERVRFRVPRDLVVAGWLVFLCVAAAVIAAVVLKVDKVVPARGVLETPFGVFPLRNMHAGHVQEILVKTGDSVRAGQTLVRFDSRVTELELEKAAADMDASARKAWADAQMVLPQLDASDKLALLERLEGVPNPHNMAGYAARLSAQSDTVQKVYSANQSSAISRMGDLRQQQALVRQSIQMLKQENARSEQLVREGFESPNSLLPRRRALLDMEIRAKALDVELQSLQGEVSRLGRERNRQLGDLALEQLRRIDDALAEHERARVQRDLLSQTLSKLEVKSPFDGVVDAVFLRGPTEHVSENTQLLTVRQTLNKEMMEIDIVLPGSMAVWVKPGMPLRASAAGNNPEDHGFLRGEITFVGQSSQEVKEVLSYRLKARITAFLLKPGVSPDAFVRPGMDLQVEIITGQRSLMSYVMDPFEKTLREAITEPN